jgi:hypothetical protein
MRRLGRGPAATAALVALLVALTGVCPCPEPARSADAHDCCATPPGFRAEDHECCSKPGDAPLVASVPIVHVMVAGAPALAPCATAEPPAPVFRDPDQVLAPASAPLILRI